MKEDEELEKLKEKRMREMQEQDQGREEAVERQKQQIWQKAKQNMTDGAIDRLSNIRTVDEQKAYTVARQVVALAESNRIGTVDDEQMKNILSEIKKDTEKDQANIKFRK